MRHTGALLVVLLISPLPLEAQDIPLPKILVANEDWREVARNLPHVTALIAEPNGTVLIQQGEQVSRLSPQGKVEKQASKAAQGVTTRAGGRYEVDRDRKLVIATATSGQRQELRREGLTSPWSLTLWPDEGHLVIGEAHGAWLWAFRIETDGSLGPGDRYYSLRTRPGQPTPVTAMTMDAAGLLYACTDLGVQAFDPTGRLSGVFPAPVKDTMTAIALGAEGGNTLLVACGEKLYARKIQGMAPYTMRKDK
jgi:hypothetical protein